MNDLSPSPLSSVKKALTRCLWVDSVQWYCLRPYWFVHSFLTYPLNPFFLRMSLKNTSITNAFVLALVSSMFREHSYREGWISEASESVESISTEGSADPVLVECVYPCSEDETSESSCYRTRVGVVGRLKSESLSSTRITLSNSASG